MTKKRQGSGVEWEVTCHFRLPLFSVDLCYELLHPRLPVPFKRTSPISINRLSPRYPHMLEWRYEVDCKIIQNQIDQKGKAIVIVFGPSPGIEHGMEYVTEVPAFGTARPHSGAFGGGYDYCFLHTPAGWMLRVTNFVQDSIRFGLTTKLPPLLIDDTAAISVNVRQIEEVRGLGPTGFMDDSDNDRTPTDRAIFPIGEEFYDKLLAWGWTPERLTEYTLGYFSTPEI